MSFERLPTEIHLEILQRVDVRAIHAMRAINHRFRNLIQHNQETILRLVLHNVECRYPHSTLLRFWPPGHDGYTLYYAGLVFRMKRIVLRVAEICNLTQNAKIDALYCISHVSNEATTMFATMTMAREDVTEGFIREVRSAIFSPLSTEQLQHMVPTSIRLVFKAAELMGEHRRGTPLHINTYTRYNTFLVAYGPGLLVALDERRLNERQEYLERIKGLWEVDFPRMHDELIRFLETRGKGLMTDPGIEIQQFLQEEDTVLDMRNADIN
jgi:hypothetical protein